MHQHSRSKLRQDPQAFIQHIAVHRNHVAGIDEQNIVRLEPPKQIERRLLHRLLNQLRQSRQSILQKRSRALLDRDEFSFASLFRVLAHRGREHQRAVPASHLNQPSRFALAHKGVGNLCIDALKKTVVEMKLMSITRGTFRKIPLAGERNNLPVQALYLLLKAKIESAIRTARAPLRPLRRTATPAVSSLMERRRLPSATWLSVVDRKSVVSG